MKKIIGIVQARTKSTRLPNKVMANIANKPMLYHVVKRLCYSKYIGQVVVATTQNSEDHSIVNWGKKNRINIFCGSDKDVLDRYFCAARKFNAEVIVRATADNPLVDPIVGDKAIKYFLDNGNEIDYVNCIFYPLGCGIEVISIRALERAWQEASKPYQREHVTPYIYEHPEIFYLVNVENNEDLSYMRWTVDEERDLEFAREVYKRLYKEGEIFLMKDILTLLRKEPQFIEINKNVKQKALVEYSLRRASE